jgi:hypothetical protein
MESHFQITHLRPLLRAADLPPAVMHDYPKQLHVFNEEGSVMSDRQHHTDLFCTYKPVTAGPQKKHWVEFQLVDELGEPLANLPWRAVNQAVRDGCVPEYTGITDAPYYNTLKARLPERPNLYLVPGLNKIESEKSEQSQRRFMGSVKSDARARLFPPYKNVRQGGLLGIGNHMMGEYMAHITHRLLDAIKPDREPNARRTVQDQALQATDG